MNTSTAIHFLLKRTTLPGLPLNNCLHMQQLCVTATVHCRMDYLAQDGDKWQILWTWWQILRFHKMWGISCPLSKYWQLKESAPSH